MSHDTEFLDRTVNFVWSIENHTIKKYVGNYSAFLKQKELNAFAEQKRMLNLEKEAKRLREYIEKNKVRTATAKQAKSREKRLEKINILPKEKAMVSPTFAFKFFDNHFSNCVNIKNLSVGYDEVILKNINLSCLKGERIRLCGFNGVGKSTMLKTIISKIPAKSGTINFCGKQNIGYFEQDLKFDNEELTPLQELLSTFPHLTEKEARQSLAKVGIVAKHVLEPLKNLSGGERCKVKICELSFQSYTMLVLDEITNHLDVIAKKSLAQAINNFGGLVIFVSHDISFVGDIKNVKEIDMKNFR